MRFSTCWCRPTRSFLADHGMTKGGMGADRRGPRHRDLSRHGGRRRRCPADRAPTPLSASPIFGGAGRPLSARSGKTRSGRPLQPTISAAAGVAFRDRAPAFRWPRQRLFLHPGDGPDGERTMKHLSRAPRRNLTPCRCRRRADRSRQHRLFSKAISGIPRSAKEAFVKAGDDRAWRRPPGSR